MSEVDEYLAGLGLGGAGPAPSPPTAETKPAPAIEPEVQAPAPSSVDQYLSGLGVGGGQAPAPPSEVDQYLSDVGAVKLPSAAEAAAAAPPAPDIPVEPEEPGTISNILEALDAPRKFVARPLLDAIAQWEVDEADPASGSSFLSAISQAIEPGQRHSVSRAQRGTLVEEEWKPESTAGQIAYAVAGLPLDIAMDPLTYVGLGVLTKAGRLAKGGAKGAKLASTWAQQAAAGDRALISVLGRPVVKAPEVFKATRMISDFIGKAPVGGGKKVSDIAKSLAEYGQRMHSTTVGLTPIAKRMHELEGLRRSEIRHIMHEAVRLGTKERDTLDDLAHAMGVIPADLDDRMIKMIDAPKASVRGIDALVESGQIPKELADRAKGFLEFDKDLLRQQQEVGIQISELGRKAYERDMRKLHKLGEKSAQRYDDARQAGEQLPGIMDARIAAEQQHANLFAEAEKKADELKEYIDQLLTHGHQPDFMPNRYATKLAGMDDVLRRMIGRLDPLKENVDRLLKREKRLRAVSQTEPAALQDLNTHLHNAKARVHRWTDVEREHVRHLVTPEALEHFGNHLGLGATNAAGKTMNTVAHIMEKMHPGGAKMRTLDLDIHAANRYAESKGLLPPGVKLFVTDPAIIKAQSVIDAGNAMGYAKMETKLFEEFGVQVQSPQLLEALSKIEKTSKALGGLEDTMTLEQMRKQFAKNKPYWQKKRTMEAKLEKLQREAVEHGGGTLEGESLEAALMRIREQADGLVPEGFTFHREGRYAGMAIPDELANWQTKMAKAADPEAQKGFIENVWKPLQNWWAGWALATPGFHARNVPGNIWNNYLHDVGDVRDYVTGMLIQNGAGQGKVANFVVKVGKALGAKGKVAEYSYDDVWEMASRGGLVDSGEHASIMRKGSMSSDVAQAILDHSKRGKKGSRVVDFVPFLPTGNNQLLAANLAIGSGFENNAKIAHLVAKLRAGWTPDAAIKSAKEALFDYRNIADGDRAIKLAAPFWTWTRYNVPHSIKKLIEKPGKYARAQQLKQSVEHSAGDKVPEGLLPEWQKEGVPIQMGRTGGKGGERALFVLNNYWPGADMAKVTSLKQLGRAAIDQLTPLVKMPFEQISNVDAFRSLGRGEVVNIDRGHQVSFLGSRIDARVAHAMRALVPLGQLDRANPGNWFGHRPGEEYPNGETASVGLIPGAELADARDRDDPSGALRAAQGLGGIRPYNYNPERELRYASSEYKRHVMRLQRELYDAERVKSPQQREQVVAEIQRVTAEFEVQARRLREQL